MSCKNQQRSMDFLCDYGFNQPINSGVGAIFSWQDAGLLLAKPNSGNYLTIYRRLFTTFTRTRTYFVFCLLGGNTPLLIKSTGAIILP
jgi:hypothetical protein